MSDVKTVVGLDPSLTGTAVCVAGSEPMRFTSKPTDGLMDRISRYLVLARCVEDNIPVGALVMLEGYSFASSGNAGRWLAEYGGILRQVLLRITPHVIEVTPGLLKKFATGKYQSDKEVVRAHVAKRWGIIHETSDETDAFVLAQIGLCYSGQQEPDNAAQREVIETLKNGPVKKKRKVKA
jgi:crossover junction endodeoxyribonuclease RuvC